MLGAIICGADFAGSNDSMEMYQANLIQILDGIWGNPSEIKNITLSIAFRNIFGSFEYCLNGVRWSSPIFGGVFSHQSFTRWCDRFWEKNGEWLSFLYHDISARALQQPEPQDGLVHHMLVPRRLDRCLSCVQRFTPKAMRNLVSRHSKLCKTPIWSGSVWSGLVIPFYLNS